MVRRWPSRPVPSRWRSAAATKFDLLGRDAHGLVSEIAGEIADIDDLLFEAPSKASQAWFVKQFGAAVNLGNIPPDEVIPLETLRLGLRADTLKEVLVDSQPAVAE